MPAYAQIITHTPEQTLQWREIAISNPGRLVRTIVLQPGHTTREGDNQGDIYPAIQVLKEISMKDQRGVENKTWTGLVNAGIAEALCKNVCEMVVFLQALPNMPEDLLKKVKEELQSPYFAPLHILCRAAVTFQYPPSKTDKKIIAALRKNWSEMMDRVWNEPENTLRPEDSHTLERMVVAQLLLKIIVTDPTFISILYEPSDLTIQIIARHWKYARGLDIALTASALYAMLEPNHPRQVAYIRTNGLESATSKIISKILVGVSPTTLSSKQQQTKTLMATFAEHLTLLTGRGAADELDFLLSIISAAKKDASEPELAKVLPKATPLWNAMFRLLKKSAKPAPASNQGSGIQDLEAELEHRLHVISNIVGISGNTLHDLTFKNPGECEPLVRIWGNENLLGALEETIELLVKMPGMTMQLCRLASIIESTISGGTPSLLRLFRTQFPRWRILGTLIRHDIAQQRITGPPPPAPMPNTMAPRDSNFWDHCVWQIFGALQFQCMDKSACSKRGCENPGTIVCMCQVTKYCSEACKTKDAKDHQLACGLIGLLENVGVTRPTTSPPIQKAKGKQTPEPDSASMATLTLEDVD